ncbi:M20 family metallopeptidase [Actinomadura kijaniata]|uniref:Amidohydrolase n=1 Tax=Actinomadura namibiensis TaxID=182080 RepID=A0A7W3LY83_ACTNM|nr:amidohydrolase [Actinomadura namibiensis]MBA8956424.1 amidohydrolase [Actinomadura namibiensis]
MADAPAGKAGDLHAELDRRAGEVERRVVGWRHHLHRYPELPNREKHTAQLVIDHLESLGLDEVRTGVAGYGVVGVLRGGLPGERVIALRADMDALPVRETSGVDFASTVVDDDYPGGPFPVAHACGHDCHTAMLMGAATVLAGARGRLPGTVLFVFQPAEEGPPADEPGGAARMEAEDALADPRPTMVYGHHVVPLPAGWVGYREGPQYAASCMIKVVVTGHQVHGSTPWEGRDPLPPAADIIAATGQLYRQVDAHHAVTVSIGHVEDVGRFNIIGERVTLWGTARCADESGMAAVQRLLTRTADHIARAYGCAARVEFLQPVPPVRNAPAWVEAALPTLRRVAGEDRTVRSQPTLGYDDVSVFVNRYGGLYVMLGVQDTEMVDGVPRPVEGGRGLVVNHDPAFYADDAALVTGVRLHAHVAADHLGGALVPRTDPAP